MGEIFQQQFVRLELMREVFPRLGRLAILANTGYSGGVPEMDEIDAALDFRNVSPMLPSKSLVRNADSLHQVSIVAGYIKERTKNAQFIVISLRNNMFELAERLVGIYKVNHMTKSVTVENRDYLALGAQSVRHQQQGQAQAQAPQVNGQGGNA